jgi:hypothetical protein
MDDFMPGSILKRTLQGIRVRQGVLEKDLTDYLVGAHQALEQDKARMPDW